MSLDKLNMTSLESKIVELTALVEAKDKEAQEAYVIKEAAIESYREAENKEEEYKELYEEACTQATVLHNHMTTTDSAYESLQEEWEGLVLSLEETKAILVELKEFQDLPGE
jgi:predicted RNase H-like nuclease (RuvC/YqgF family)